MSMQENAGKTIVTETPLPMLTRRELPTLLSAAGYPTTLGTLHQLTSKGKGPPVAQRWGHRTHYVVADVLAWAQKRASKRRKRRRRKLIVVDGS